MKARGGPGTRLLLGLQPEGPEVTEAKHKEYLASELRGLERITNGFGPSALPDLWREIWAGSMSPRARGVALVCVVADTLKKYVQEDRLNELKHGYRVHRDALSDAVSDVAVLLAPDAAKAHSLAHPRPAAKAGRTRQADEHKKKIQRWINEAAKEVERTHTPAGLRELSSKKSYYDLLIQELKKRNHKQRKKGKLQPVKWYREMLHNYDLHLPNGKPVND